MYKAPHVGNAVQPDKEKLQLKLTHPKLSLVPSAPIEMSANVVSQLKASLSTVLPSRL